MRTISFMWFKQHCKHFERDYDFSRDCCNNGGHATKAIFATIPDGPRKGQKYFYHPCMEKHCPVLGSCKALGVKT